jgi:elongation factor P
MSLAYTDLKKGVLFVLDGAPYEVLDSHFLRMQQRKAVVQTKIRNLITGKILDRNFQPSDSFEEAEVERKPAMFIYVRVPSAAKALEGKEYWFHEEGNPKNRFMLSAEILGARAQFLKPNTEVETLVFNEKVIGVKLPVKVDFKVTEAPPAIKGNTAQGGSKAVILEGGAKVSAPLFVNEGDVVKINTETGEYVERVELAK